MSAAKNGPGAVRVSRVPSKPLRREEDGNFAIDLWVRRDGAFISDIALHLSPAEAESLHVQLCYALDDETAALITPADLLPDCRKGARAARRR
ncbi:MULTISPECIES: hypothetical protein [Streptomyces]|uniref:Uncharacterized protein n=2 Tax=Streptomyces rimosus subsp. rimosus TaxID=132474 RepID=A0A8A1UU76_STRR1|nr:MULTISPECIES: hypothetical protein [Streptomyces]MYT43845.1 hypothetical protein [Streptomyces sp. SID5471]KOT41168.1 hypothetical protein ADK84_12375 [Streptomyces sp. NRRL WC-3701]KOT46139.1 hypothetical protein ADK42_01280 [Streptomyces rimosus subsp. rimosus]QGY65191.1 hypothetical protein V519_004180 [Streptomyces rimosus R6-500]QST82124.1 hypothetical protein SRIM_019960 [Streptomyces rimosus subsp. rimosus ATCC 10970]